MIAIPYIVDNIHHIEKMLSDSLDIKGTVPIRLHPCKFSKKIKKEKVIWLFTNYHIEYGDVRRDGQRDSGYTPRTFIFNLKQQIL